MGKKRFLSHFDIVPVIQIVGRKGTNTKTEEHTSALGRAADPYFFVDPDPDSADSKYMDLD